MTIIFKTIGTCLVSAALFAGHNHAAAEVTIVHAGWLLAVPGEAPARRQSIVVEEGRITEVIDGFVGQSGFGNKDSIHLVDLSNAFVLPGLIDAHVHLASAPGNGDVALAKSEADLAITASRHAALILQAGFTTVVDLGAAGIPGHENAIFAVRDAVRDGAIPGPRILAAGTPIAATGLSRSPSYRDEVMATMDRRAVCDGADDCRRAVRHQVRRGSDIIVFFNTGSLLDANPVVQTMTAAEMHAIVDAAHALGRKVIADGHHAAGIEAADRAGVDVVDSLHLYGSTTFKSLSQDVFVQSHIYGITQAVGETSETLHDGLWGWLPGPLLLRLQAIRMRPFAVIEAYRAGIRNIAYASDAGVYTWGENAADLVEYVTRGIPEAEAIRIATLSSARMLGLDNDLGSIEPGKMADIIATSRSPLRDISSLRKVCFVMRSGVVRRGGNNGSACTGDGD